MDCLLTAEQNKSFIANALRRAGCLYCWPDRSNGYSGKDLRSAQYTNVYDCSGLVTCSLYDGTGIDWRATKNAQALHSVSGMVSSPEPGDLCFYGSSPAFISHVMLWVGKDGDRFGGPCFGASGGDHTTLNPQIAMARDAKVRGFKSHKYRPDFISFGRLAKHDGP